MPERRFCTVRFNLKKEAHQKAWLHLQSMDRKEYKSYSSVIITALNLYFENTDLAHVIADMVLSEIKGKLNVCTSNVLEIQEVKEDDIAWDFIGD